MLCKHFDTSKGCVYKDKCQFAHGAQELKSTINSINNNSSSVNMTEKNNNNNFMNPTKKMPNPSNYKIVKCKNYEMGKEGFI